MINMDSYLDEITAFLRTKGLTYEPAFLNETTYPYLGSGFMVQYLIEQIDELMTQKNYRKIFEILNMMTPKFLHFNINIDKIASITWKERECDTTDTIVSIDGIKICLSREMVFKHVYEWWHDIYREDPNIISLKYRCQNATLTDNQKPITTTSLRKNKLIGGIKRILFKSIYRHTMAKT